MKKEEKGREKLSKAHFPVEDIRYIEIEREREREVKTGLSELVCLQTIKLKLFQDYYFYLIIFPVTGIPAFQPPGLGSYSMRATASYY